jgi:beta-lactam-binding protein with PASTA domain
MRGTTIAAVVILAVVLAAIVGYLFADGDDQASLPVPDVRGMTIQEGASALQRLGLCVGVEQGSGPERRPIVVEQRPQPGVLLLEGSVVTIVNVSPSNLAGVYGGIGSRNRELRCTEGLGVGGEDGGAG